MTGYSNIKEKVEAFLNLKAQGAISAKDWLFTGFSKGLSAMGKKYDAQAQDSMRAFNDHDYAPMPLSSEDFPAHFAKIKMAFGRVQFGNGRAAFEMLEGSVDSYNLVKDYNNFLMKEFLPRLKELEGGQPVKASDTELFTRAKQPLKLLLARYEKYAPDELKPNGSFFEAYKGFLNEMIALLPPPSLSEKAHHRTDRHMGK